MTDSQVGSSPAGPTSADPAPADAASADPSPAGPSPAEVFEQFFGPSLSAPWARVLLEHAELRRDDHVLDLACATGVVARTVAANAGADGESAPPALP